MESIVSKHWGQFPHQQRALAMQWCSPRTGRLFSCSHLTLLARGFKFISRLPCNQSGLARGFPSQGETEAGHAGIAGEIHLRPVFVARLMVAMLVVVLRLLLAPFAGMAGKLDSLIDGK